MNQDVIPQDLLAQYPTCPRDIMGRPRVFAEGHGAYLTDLHGGQWIDFDNGRGAVLLGHGEETVAEAVARAARGGLGAATAWSPGMDELLGVLHGLFDGDALALYRTGTAAVRSAACAVRAARDRPLILSSGYHGYDPMWRYEEPFVPNADGVVDFLFDLEVLEEWLVTKGESVATVIVSPDRMYLGDRWYGEFARILREADVPVIADEVKVGLRYEAGLSVDAFAPDVWVVAKALANGAPIAALGGDSELLGDLQEESFTSYFEPTVLAAALATLAKVGTGEPQEAIRAAGDLFIEHARKAFASSGVPIEISGNGNLFQFVCADPDVEAAFHAASAAEQLLFFEGDNQAPSAAFTGDVVDDACTRIDAVCDALSGRWPDTLVTEDSRYAAAFNAIDGLPDFPRDRERMEEVVKMLWEE
jgi:neamine transaminase/2'-deamino-2'-hydroxyneamine transaminase/neomycin C transaminase